MQPILKASTFALVATLFFSSINFAQGSQSTFTFETLSPSESKSATISFMTPYVRNLEVIEFIIARTQLPTTGVGTVFMNLRNKYKVTALTEILQTHPDARFILNEREAKHGMWIAPHTDSFESVWVEGSDVKLDLGNGQAGAVSDVTEYYIRQSELSTGVYKGFLAKFREVRDEQFCLGVFAQKERCSGDAPKNH